MIKRAEKHDVVLRKKAKALLKKSGYYTDYKIYCCDIDRGYCCNERKIIVIPLWAIERGKENCKTYWIYYLSHELAHAINHKNGNKITSHGSSFMECFKSLCPKYLQHFELGYKPRNAKAAGISR